MKIFSSVLNIIFFALSGVMAPFIFKTVHDRRMAGFFAGGLFLMTALRALKLSLLRPYPRYFRFYFISYFFIVLSFWLWRFLDKQELSSHELWGVNGRVLHPTMTGLYVLSFILLVFCESKLIGNKLRSNNKLK